MPLMGRGQRTASFDAGSGAEHPQPVDTMGNRHQTAVNGWHPFRNTLAHIELGDHAGQVEGMSMGQSDSTASNMPSLGNLRLLAVWLPVVGIGTVIGLVVLLVPHPRFSALLTLRLYLATMTVMAAGAYGFSRYIFGLRTAVSRGLGLIPTLTEYLHHFSELTGVGVKIKIDDDDATHLAPHTEVQLIRIIQEALNNVRKHARAERAWVIFEPDDGQVRITIRDNGRGFQRRSDDHTVMQSFGL